MTDVNAKKLEQVIETALARVEGDKRWTNAINKAADMIESNPFVHWTGDSLLILSDSGKLYEAGGVCQCRAYLEGQPCKHRAAYKIVKRYNEIAH